MVDIRENDLHSSNGKDFGALDLEIETSRKTHMHAPLRLSLGNGKSAMIKGGTAPKVFGEVNKTNKNKPILAHHNENTNTKN